MVYKTYNLSLEEEDMLEIGKLTSNTSEFTRQSIKEKLGKADKSLQEEIIDLEEAERILKQKEERVTLKISKLLDSRQELKQREIEEIESFEKIKEEKFQSKTNSIKDLPEFGKLIEEVRIKPDLLKDTMFLDSFVVGLRERNPLLRIGVTDLREILQFLL